MKGAKKVLDGLFFADDNLKRYFFEMIVVAYKRNITGPDELYKYLELTWKVCFKIKCILTKNQCFMICYNQETLNLALKEEEKPISITDSANEILLNFAEELKIENSTLLEPLVSYYFIKSQNSFRFMFFMYR